MASIIIIVFGIAGILGTLWLSYSRIRSAEYPVAAGDEWFHISPQKVEEIVSTKVREHARNVMKVILTWMLGIYHRISRQITVKQLLKKKVRAFLYDHTPDSIRHPSDFWHKVRHHDNAKKNNNPVEPE